MGFKARALAALALLVAMTSLVGCIKAEVTFTLNPDGSGEYGVMVLMDQYLAAIGEQGTGDGIFSMMEKWRAEGYDVKPLRQEEMIGFRAVRKVEDLAAAFGKGISLGEGGELFGEGSSLEFKNGLFSKTLDLVANIDLGSAIMDEAGQSVTEDEFEQFGQALLSSIQFDFKMSLPFEAQEHNASSVNRDAATGNYIYTWNLMVGKVNPVELHASVSNMTPVYVGAAAALAVVLVAALLTMARRGRGAGAPPVRPGSPGQPGGPMEPTGSAGTAEPAGPPEEPEGPGREGPGVPPAR